MRSSEALYDSLAATYDDHFAVPHRRAYDDLAWQLCSAAIPAAPSTVVDIGCGVGRWAQRLVSAGYRVIGVEPAPVMAVHAKARLEGCTGFTLVDQRVEEVEIAAGSVDAVIAMGSLQYTEDPGAAIARAAVWLRPGGVLCVLVDSLQALVLELLAADRTTEALERVRTRRGVWQVDDLTADLHLLDMPTLRASVEAAGLDVVQAAGLLVGASAYGRAELNRRLVADYPAALAAEALLAGQPQLADFGKQLLIVARSPAR